MTRDDFVPPDFVVPLRLETPPFTLEPLGPEHNERDYGAWMSSIDYIRRSPGFDKVVRHRRAFGRSG